MSNNYANIRSVHIGICMWGKCKDGQCAYDLSMRSKYTHTHTYVEEMDGQNMYSWANGKNKSCNQIVNICKKG